MRAGKLTESITIERCATTINPEGTPVETWSVFAVMRAQIIQATTEEFIRGYGASSEAVMVFRIRWLDGVNVADRIAYGGRIFDLKEIKEIGRRRGLELRCIARG